MPKLKDLIVRVPGMEKSSQESPDEVQLEQDFANMAFVFLQNRAPQIIPNLVGFEIVEKEEDGSRVVGMFGFKISDSFYYVPVFFLNNQIKGMDIIVSKKDNFFMPLRETWLHEILNKDVLELGKRNGDKKIQEDLEYPNFDFLKQPNYSKSAGDAKTISDDLRQTWDSMQDEIIKAASSDPEFRAAFAGSIAKMKGDTVKELEDVSTSKLIPFLKNAGGPKAVKKLLTKLSQDIDFAKAASEFYSHKDLFINEFDGSLKPVKKASKIKVTTKSYEGMNDSDKAKIVDKGFSIIDARPPEDKSQLFDIEYTVSYSNPDKGGVYDMVLENGILAKVWLFKLAPVSKEVDFLVVNPKDNTSFVAPGCALFVKPSEDDNIKDPYSKAKTSKSVKVGNKYVFINDKFEATVPVCIDSFVSNGDKSYAKVYDHSYSGYDSNPYHVGTFDAIDRQPGSAAHYVTGIRQVRFLDREGDKLSIVGLGNSNYKLSIVGLGNSNYSNDTLLLPTNWKALEISQDSQPEFKPGSLTDLDMALNKSAIHKIVVENPDHGSEYYISLGFGQEGPMVYKQAAIKLVAKYGLAVPDAETMLKEADADIKSRRLVKLAQFEEAGIIQPNPTLDPQFGSNSDLGTMEETPFYEETTGGIYGNPVMQNTSDPRMAVGGELANLEGGGDMTQEVMNLANQAAQTGQKNVFDHSSIAGLVQTYDSSSVIDQFLGTFKKAIDSLGRLLFMFYWKNEDFAERYGSEDLTEMEDGIRGVFKSFGDLYLKLKQKSAVEELPGDMAVV